MKFTAVFSSLEDADYSFGLVFIPCPVWVQGDKEIINLHPENPSVQSGDVAKLLSIVPGLRDRVSSSCLLIIHPDGYGSDKDFQTLLKDLGKEGFQVQYISTSVQSRET